MENDYKSFLKKLETKGHSELEFIKFLRNYYFPGTPSQISKNIDDDTDSPLQKRDFSRYSFNANKNLKKRKVVHVVVTNLLLEKNVEVDDINRFSKKYKITPKVRPLVADLNTIPTNMLNRYYSKPQDLIEVNGVKYAVYNQFGGTEFDKLCSLLNATYKTNIVKHIS